MTTTTPKPGFPLRSAVITLSMGAIGAWVLCVAALPMLLGNGPGMDAAVAVGALAAWCGALAGLVPVMMLASTGVIGAVMGYLYGTAFRLLVCLTVFAGAAFLHKLPMNALAGAMIASYFILLAVDAAFIHRYLSVLPSPKPGGGSSLDSPVSPASSSGSSLSSDAQTPPPKPPEVMV